MTFVAPQSPLRATPSNARRWWWCVAVFIGGLVPALAPFFFRHGTTPSFTVQRNTISIWLLVSLCALAFARPRGITLRIMGAVMAIWLVGAIVAGHEQPTNAVFLIDGPVLNWPWFPIQWNLAETRWPLFWSVVHAVALWIIASAFAAWPIEALWRRLRGGATSDP